MRCASLFLALLAACAGPSIPYPKIDRPAPLREGQSDAPNIVLIMADDLGLEAFGCYGGESYATPRIDALAAQGMQFEHVYSQTLCTPSRVKLMTGRSNLRNYTQFSMLKPGERTFGHVLQSAGYVTGVFGKWQLLGAEHYGEDAGKGTHPRDAGFDEWCLWQVEVLGSRYADPTYEHNGVLVREQTGSYGPDVSCAALLDFAKRHRERAFLAYYPMVLTHSPFQKTPDSPPEKQTRQQRFADMVAYMDQIVGRIEDGLLELGLRENTIILFTTDNGTEQGIVSRFRGRELAGAKTRSTDAGIHVPLIAAWPGVIPPGEANHDLIDFSDFLPTLAELGDAAIPEDRVIDGVSFATQLRGAVGSPREFITIYSNPRPPGSERNPRVRLARDKQFKLYDDGRLYDCIADPDELAPLSLAKLDPIARAAHQKLQAALDAMPDEPRLLQ
jgi:arylsulfatase A